jgi:hypothetical protein
MTMETLQSNTQQVSVLNALIPPEGPLAISFALNFAEFQEYVIDTTLSYAQGKITAIQAIWIDNSDNPDPFEIVTDQAPYQRVICPALTQGAFPIIAPVRAKFRATTGSTEIVTVILLNVPLNTGTWTASRGGDPVPPGVTEIAAGGTAVTVFTDINRGGTIMNPFSAGESLFIDAINSADTISPGANGTTFELVPGAAFELPAGTVFALVTANAVTTGHTFAAMGY